jgi:hypothetical protein
VTPARRADRDVAAPAMLAGLILCIKVDKLAQVCLSE